MASPEPEENGQDLADGDLDAKSLGSDDTGTQHNYVPSSEESHGARLYPRSLSIPRSVRETTFPMHPRSDRTSSTTPSQTEGQFDLVQEADFYNRIALERAVIGEASGGSTRVWSLVDVPPGTYSVTLNGIGGGSQVITWQMHNGARRSRFTADDQEFVGLPDFETEPDKKQDNLHENQQPRDQSQPSYTETIDASQSSAEARYVNGQSSLEDLLAQDDSKYVSRHSGGTAVPQEREFDVTVAASQSLPSSPTLSPSLKPHLVRKAYSSSDAKTGSDSAPENEDTQNTSPAVELLPPKHERTVRIATPNEETPRAYTGRAATRVQPVAPSSTFSEKTSPEPSITKSSNQKPEYEYVSVRSGWSIPKSSGADFSSESEVNPEDSISRTMRPNSASSNHWIDSRHARKHSSTAQEQRYNPRYQYRGLIFCAPDSHSLEGIDERSWELVKKFRMPLHQRDIYKEAAQRAGATSTLDQLLLLPNDFLRERVDEEIEFISIESQEPNKATGYPTLEWCLLGVCIEQNRLMLFLVGVPTVGNIDRSDPTDTTMDSPVDGDLADFPRLSSNGLHSPEVQHPLLQPRSRLSPEPTGPGASVDDLLSQTGAPSSISAYRPSVNIANRYPVSNQRLDQRHRGRSTQRAQNTAGSGPAPKLLNAPPRQKSTGRPERHDTNTATDHPLGYLAANMLPTPRRVLGVDGDKLRDKASDIQFTDALGRTFTFPWHLAKSYDGIKDLIETAFLHVDMVRTEVREGHYDLLGPGQMVILPKLWEDLVEPGWHVTMQMWSTLTYSKLPESNSPSGPLQPNGGPAAAAYTSLKTGPTANLTRDVTPPPLKTGVDRVDSAGSKYVLSSQTSAQTPASTSSSTYLDLIKTLKGQMPHLTNMLATDCRNPNGGRVYCWDTLRVGERPVLARQAGPQNWRVGGNGTMSEVLGHPARDVKMRTIVVEDLSPALIECLGTAFWLNPEFFEEHLSQSGYQGAECRGTPPKTWSTNATVKDYISIKWHRPIERNDLPPHTARERQILLALEDGFVGWTSESSADQDVSDEWDPDNADIEGSGPSIGSSIAAVWEERATLYQTRIGQCPILVVLIDPLPRVRYHVQERSTVEPLVRSELLYRQAYNRNSVGSMSSTAGIFAKGALSPQELVRHQLNLRTTNSTAQDIQHWLDEAAQLTPDNPDLSILTALLWVIHRDTIGFMHLVSNILEEIGLGSTDDNLVRTNLAHWRDLISQFQVELPELKTNLELFTQTAQDINPVEPLQSIVSEFIPETLVQIDILIEQNEKSYAALRADMGVLESRKAIAEAESVGKLTELAFIFIPLTFITGAFSMQIEELQTPAPVWAFVIAAVVAITIAYSVRFVMRSDSINRWTHTQSHRVRKHAHLPVGSPVPLTRYIAYAVSYALPGFLLRSFSRRGSERRRRRRRRLSHAYPVWGGETTQPDTVSV